MSANSIRNQMKMLNDEIRNLENRIKRANAEGLSGSNKGRLRISIRNKKSRKNKLAKNLQALNRKPKGNYVGYSNLFGNIFETMPRKVTRTPPSRGNSAMSMAPPPLPPKTRGALLLQESSKPELVHMANKVTGIPKSTLQNNFTKPQLAQIAMQPRLVRRVGPFGRITYRQEYYDPSRNIRVRAREGLRNFGRRVRNIPNRTSAAYHGGLGAFFARKAANYTQRAKLANTRRQQRNWA